MPRLDAEVVFGGMPGEKAWDDACSWKESTEKAEYHIFLVPCLYEGTPACIPGGSSMTGMTGKCRVCTNLLPLITFYWRIELYYLKIR